jgi:nucleotidyltransferase/DNA polymerase involved in DNA repair
VRAGGKVSYQLYREASERVFKVIRRFGAVVEKGSGLDEAFLDVTALCQKRVRSWASAGSGGSGSGSGGGGGSASLELKSPAWPGHLHTAAAAAAASGAETKAGAAGSGDGSETAELRMLRAGAEIAAGQSCSDCCLGFQFI